MPGGDGGSGPFFEPGPIQMVGAVRVPNGVFLQDTDIDATSTSIFLPAISGKMQAAGVPACAHEGFLQRSLAEDLFVPGVYGQLDGLDAGVGFKFKQFAFAEPEAEAVFALEIHDFGRKTAEPAFQVLDSIKKGCLQLSNRFLLAKLFVLKRLRESPQGEGNVDVHLL